MAFIYKFCGVLSIVLVLQYVAYCATNNINTELHEKVGGENVDGDPNQSNPDRKISERKLNKPPNIVFILADDYGWHDIGYHGSEIETPTLDKLAATGVKLENYYVQPICTPTRSQLMSGRYQINTGLQHKSILAPMPYCLPLSLPTLADRLKVQGYMNHIIGKWHLGFYRKECLPMQRGFDSFYGYLTGAETYYTHVSCILKMCGIDLWDGYDHVLNNTQYSTHLFTQKAEEVISAHNTTKPLFLYLPYQAVHEPLEAPEFYTKKLRHIKNNPRRRLAAMATILDEAVRNVTTALQKRGLWENTILIFSTDNGGQIKHAGSNWPLRGNKATLWEGGIRAVGFVHSPLLSNGGTTSHALMHVSDWFPTLVQRAGGTTADLQLDGFDMWPTISRGEPSPRKEILHNIDPFNGHRGELRPGSPFDNRIRAAIRVGDWKLITGDPGMDGWYPPLTERKQPNYLLQPLAGDKNLWLFNIKTDPLEKTDVSDTEEDKVNELLTRLQFYNKTAVPATRVKLDYGASPDLHDGRWGPWIV